MEEFQSKKYIRKQSGIPVTVLECKHDQVKETVTLVLSNEVGELIDARFQLTGDFAKVAEASMKKIKTILGIASLKESVGKKLGIHVNKGIEFTYKKGPKAGQKGISYNVSGYFPAQNLESQSEGQDEGHTNENIPF